jgi:hypothetical protein
MFWRSSNNERSVVTLLDRRSCWERYVQHIPLGRQQSRYKKNGFGDALPEEEVCWRPSSPTLLAVVEIDDERLDLEIELGVLDVVATGREDVCGCAPPKDRGRFDGWSKLPCNRVVKSSKLP